MLPAVLTAVCALSAFNKPWFCHDLDCPVFESRPDIKVDNTTVEVRRYAPSQLWVSTVLANTELTQAEHDGFQRLFDYISGHNVLSKKIDMTSPVRNFVRPSQGPFCATNFTVSFYVPYAYQPQLTSGAVPPPKPSDPKVFVAEDSQALTVAVLSFPGFTNEDSDVVTKAAQLEQLLQKAGVQYDQENWYFAAYDPPFRLSNRHNEIWVQVHGRD